MVSDDPRIEVAARAISVARGADPDGYGWRDVVNHPNENFPNWRAFENLARDMIAVIDALAPPPMIFGARKFTLEEIAEMRKPGGFVPCDGGDL